MKITTTLLLLLLAAGGSALYWKSRGDAPATAPSEAPLLDVKAAKVESLKVVNAAGTLELKAAEGKGLELPGNWPVRGPERQELLDAVTNLKSQFQPIPVDDKTDMKDYGLAESQKPIAVEIKAGDATRTLRFGKPPAKPGENPFVVPTYVRIDGKPEIRQLGPDVLTLLNRDPDYYRKRQLFPDSQRVKFTDAGNDSPTPTPILGDAVTGIDVKGPSGDYTLTRRKPTPKAAAPAGKPSADEVLAPHKLADAWWLASPIVDRVDPAKLKAVLAGIPDLWVEKFVDVKEADKTGLDPKDKPLELTLKLADGGTRTLLVGKVARSTTKTEPPPPQQPGQPPMPPRIISEDIYYAKLANNPQVFELKGERIDDLFFNKKADVPVPEMPPARSAVTELRDRSLVRFDNDNVTKIQITRPDHTTLVFEKTKADLKTGAKERWDIVQPFKGPAEAGPINDLLRPFESMRTGEKDIIDRPALQALLGPLGAIDLQLLKLDLASATEVRITDGEGTKTLYIGAHDAGKKKLYARVEGQDRVNVVGDEAVAALAKPALAYRSLKLFDLADNRVDRVKVQRGKAETFAIEEQPGESKWLLTAPAKTEADSAKASSLANDLGSLQAAEYLPEPMTDAKRNLAGPLLGSAALAALPTDITGFAEPSLKIDVHFAGPNPPKERTLIVGKARADKPDQFYAKFADAPDLFALNKSSLESLNAGVVAFLPAKLWTAPADDIASITVQKGTESPYTLKREGDKWKLAAPFDVDVSAGTLAPLLGSLANGNAVRYEAYQAADLAKFGLDKPALKLTFTAKEKAKTPEAKETTVERTLLVGNAEGADKPNRFAMLAGQSTVFLVNDLLFKDADRSALDLLPKELLNLKPDAVTKIARDGKEPFTLVKDGTGWKPEGPAFPLDKPEVDGLVATLTKLNAEKFAGYGSAVDWAKLGLDAAAKPATWTITAGDKTHTIQVGVDADKKSVVRVDNGPGAAFVDPEAAKDLGFTKLDLADKTLTKFDSLELQGIKRTMDGKELAVSNERSGWELTAPKKERADQDTLDELAARLSNLRAAKVVAIDAKDLKPFDLDPPAAVVTLDRLDAKGKAVEYKLKIGKPSKEHPRRVQLEGSTTVVELPGDLADKLAADPLAFRDRTLATFVNADKIAVDGPNGKRTYTKGPAGWKLSDPLDAEADDPAIRELHDQLARLRAAEWVAEKPEKLDGYGLEKPTKWKLFAGDKEVLSLQTGSADGKTFAKLEKGESVARLDKALADRFGAELRKREFWPPADVAPANGITIDGKDKEDALTLFKGPNGWIDPKKPTEKFTQEQVSDFLDCLASLKAERFVQDKDGDLKLHGLEPPERTITVTLPNGRKTLELGRLDDSKRAYAKFGDGAVVVLSVKDTERLMKDRAGFQKPAPPIEKKATPKGAFPFPIKE